MDPYKKNIKEEILCRCDDLSIEEIESILKDLIKETKIEFYNIKLEKIEPDCIKSIMIISNLGYNYEISFKNIKSDYREYRLNRILKKQIKL